MQTPDLVPIIPELILLVTACVALLVEPFLKPGGSGRTDRTALIAITLTGLIGSVAVSLGLSGEDRESFAGMLVLDDWAVFFNVLFGVAAILTVLMSPAYLEAHRRHLGEYYALLLFAVIGMDLMAAARDFILLYVAIELMAISSYLLAAFFRYRIRSNEASLKYFLTGSFASAILLYGVSLVYGQAGATNYSATGRAVAEIMQSGATGSKAGVLLAVFLVAIGLAFKVSAAPFHMWTPDVYQGAPTPIAAFFSVGPKAAAFSAILAAFILAFPGAATEWGVFFIVLAIATMLVGNLYALVQTNVKRMLAYSTIAHMGYLLMGLVTGSPLGVSAVLFYSLVYALMTIGAFAVVILIGRESVRGDEIEDFAGLAQRSPLAAAVMLLFLLSLTGIPPTAGFVGKFYLFAAAVEAGYIWLVLIALVNSAISLFYYMRVAAAMYMRELPSPGLALSPSLALHAAILLAALGTLLLGIYPGPLLDFAKASAAGFGG